MRLIFFILLISYATHAQKQTEFIDFLSANVDVVLNRQSQDITGSVDYQFKVLNSIDSLVVDARNLVGHDILLDGESVAYDYSGEEIVLKFRFRESVTHHLTINFTSMPSRAFYFVDVDYDNYWEQAWTQGQGKFTSNWLPSFDDVNEKLVWNFNLTAPQNLTAIANGELVSRKDNIWNYQMEQPMSSYLVAIAVADYDKRISTSKSGVPIINYYYPSDQKKVANTYQHTVEIFDFFEEELKVPYPWSVYKQAPVKDFLYSGMENTAMTLFNDQFVTDSIAVNDRSYVTVNAHEMAHQWFGNLVTAQSDEHHWLQEGLATYYSMLAEEKLYGNEHFQMLLYQAVESLDAAQEDNAGTSLLDPKASSLTFYQRGAWALHALKDLIGETDYRKGITAYLREFQYRSATTADFLRVMENQSSMNLAGYCAIWLESKEFPTAAALEILQKDSFVKKYYELAAMRVARFDDAYPVYKKILESPVSQYLLKEMVMQLNGQIDPRKYVLLGDATRLGSVEVRQLIARSTEQLNAQNQRYIKSMLDDPSYVTRESVLYLMWNAATDRREFLQETRKRWAGFNPSLDMAWNAMALSSKDYAKEDLKVFLKRLRSYTAPEYAPSTRTAALDYLINLDLMGYQNYIDLMDASINHVWRFYKNSRDLLKSLNKKEKYQPVIKQALAFFEGADKNKIQRILKNEL